MSRNLFPAGEPARLTRAHGRVRNLERRAVRTRRTLLVDIDANGAVISPGLVRRRVAIHFDCIITGWRLLGDVAGDIVIDIWKANYASYPPTIANTIVAGAPPTLSGTDHDEDTTLPGWTTAISSGDVLFFHIDSAATLTSVDLSLAIRYI